LRQFFNLLAGSAPTTTVVHQLLIILAIIALLWFVGWLCRRIQGYSLMHLEIKVMKDLYLTEFNYLIRHSHEFFVSRFAGSLTHKMSKFVHAYETLFDDVFLEFFPTFLFIVGAIVVLFIRNHTLGIALGLWSVLFFTFQIWVAQLRQPIRMLRSEADTRVTATVADAIGSHSTITFFSGARFELGILDRITELWTKARLRSWSVDEMIWGGLGIFMITIQVGLLYGAVMFWRQGLLTVGDFVLIQMYLLTTFDRLVVINRGLRRFYDSFADAGEMVELMQMPHDIRDREGARALVTTKGDIAFTDVGFSFSSDRLVLERFNLNIRGGEKVALVGPSGAGKTTVTKLLLRLYDAVEGIVAIDGQDITRVTQEGLRDSIAFVPQEPVLFHRSLMDNIRYGKRDATDEEVMEAAKQAHCHEFISTLPQGYETFVGERGVKLSGGERQRVAIARAILKNAPILVLDEATSSLDSESESLIQDALKTLMQGKTVIVIAHRLSTIMNMDRIVVMDAGGIVDQGTHAELLAKDGIYQKLWSIQAGGFLRGLAEEAETD
jgi:ATP-binding cassette subfamily B protein